MKKTRKIRFVLAAALAALAVIVGLSGDERENSEE